MADVPVMAGKSVLVTGGTGGIGEATAIRLAALGARVGITGRDQARTEAAAAGIRAAAGTPAVDAFAADMSAQSGVRGLAAQVLATYPRLDVLVNNVGGFWAHRRVTADGLEHTFALNHLAPFLLTSLLLDRLTASAPARIVTVLQCACRGCIDFSDLQGERNYSGQRAYSQSKLANIMFTYELARRLEGTGVTATVLHPGVVRTSFGAEDQAVYFAVMARVARPFMKTPARGAGTLVYLASSPEVEGITGQYYAHRKPKTSSKAACDATAAVRLWQASASLAGLTATAWQPESSAGKPLSRSRGSSRRQRTHPSDSVSGWAPELPPAGVRVKRERISSSGRAGDLLSGRGVTGACRRGGCWQ